MQELIGSLDALKSTDPETYEAIVAEEQRKRGQRSMISEQRLLHLLNSGTFKIKR